jgi:16S rRNA (cytosine967-C5)-methyltransferase
VQDQASAFVGAVLDPRVGERIYDACAAPGGKTLHACELVGPTGGIVAADVSASRLGLIARSAARLRFQPWLLAQDATASAVRGLFDRVLVDAPCSGFGTLRRNPDLKWRQTAEAIPELAAKQARILAAAATLVKAGGRLVYATCSVLPDENEAIVDAFVGAHPEFTLGDAAAELKRAGVALDTGRTLKLSTARHGCDGFFAAVLERSA